MMEAGVHFGHGTRKWNPRMAPYMSAKRKGIHITNLTRTARFLSEACDLVFDAASKGNQFLIVGTKNKAVDFGKRWNSSSKISKETVAGIEISFKEKDIKYLEFLFVSYTDDSICKDRGSYNCKPRSNLWKNWFIHSS
ncbi:uncharacterized protein LOC113360016 [Papaver somniferum]|uniref:uncharacterized protein LOC113360016 n=1 Tax=Papaver somniferum TaxID=3469 RepID=UPI000E6F95EA|nr:uncharacterized protein LOC113360016 [Papaver somniferum]